MQNNKPTAWMIRRDGLEIPVVQHIYGSANELDETLYAAQWLYENTAEEGTRALVLSLIAAYGAKLARGRMNPARAIIKDIRKKSYVFLTESFVREHYDQIPWGEPGNIDELAQKVNEALNQEFLRARYGGLYSTKPGSRDMYFRVSSNGFDWGEVIEGFLLRHSSWVDTVTVVRDEESTGEKFYYKDSSGQRVKLRSTRPMEKAFEGRRVKALTELSRAIDSLDPSLMGCFDLPGFCSLVVKLYDYIRVYMSGPVLHRDEVRLICELKELCFTETAEGVSREELEICRNTIETLLYQMECGNIEMNLENGRIVTIEYYTRCPDKDDEDGIGPANSMVPLHDEVNLDDFENELKRVVKKLKKER